MIGADANFFLIVSQARSHSSLHIMDVLSFRSCAISGAAIIEYAGMKEAKYVHMPKADRSSLIDSGRLILSSCFTFSSFGRTPAAEITYPSHSTSDRPSSILAREMQNPFASSLSRTIRTC